jgi:hypothetical protein
MGLLRPRIFQTLLEMFEKQNGIYVHKKLELSSDEIVESQSKMLKRRLRLILEL